MVQFSLLIQTIKEQQGNWIHKPEVLYVQPGFRVTDDEIQPETILVVLKLGHSAPRLPEFIHGIPIETRFATVQETVFGFLPLSAWEGVLLESAPPPINYIPPDSSEATLLEREVHNITCHVGPDSGWSTLKPFLEQTNRSLTVAMYDFYADHIIETINHLGQTPQITLSMILQAEGRDGTMPTPIANRWGNRLTFIPAAVKGPRRIFNNSYHTKVAVRDSTALWLSSGNWTPTSQPVIGVGAEPVLYTKGNREWHLVIEDEPLAKMYETFILYDMRKAAEAAAFIPESSLELPDLLIPETMFLPKAVVTQPRPFAARTFARPGEDPIRVKALMSPDNYAAEILALIKAAERSLYLQFSYIRQPSTALFDQIISAIAEKMQGGLDVKVLVGTNQDQNHSILLTTQRGWKRSMFRRQTSKVHNKGILIDDRITVVGSNNWSSDGTQYNRDTSLVLFSEGIAAYYREVFLFDWDNLSRPIVSNSPGLQPELASANATTPPGMIRVAWNTWFDN